MRSRVIIVKHAVFAQSTSADIEGIRQVVILDLIPHMLPKGGAASALDLARGPALDLARGAALDLARGHGHRNSFIGRHFWLVGLGLGMACFVAAVVKPANFAGNYVSYRVSAIIWSVLGAVMLIIAVYFGVTHGW